jgi:hypothetical protein
MVVLPVPPITEPLLGILAIEGFDEFHITELPPNPGRVTVTLIFVMLPLDIVKVGGCIFNTGGAFTITVQNALYPPFSVVTVIVAIPGVIPLRLPD